MKPLYWIINNKCGYSSLSEYFTKNKIPFLTTYVRHNPNYYSSLKEKISNNDDMIVYTNIRDPIDRIVSNYNFLKGLYPKDISTFSKFIDYVSKNMCSYEYINNNKTMSGFLAMTQLHTISYTKCINFHTQGKNIDIFYIRLKNIKDDVKDLCKLIGHEYTDFNIHANKSQKKMKVKDILPRDMEIIKKIYKDDIELYEKVCKSKLSVIKK